MRPPSRPAQIELRCTWCGSSVVGHRRTCSASWSQAARDAQDPTPFRGAEVARLRELRAAGEEPVGVAARAQIGARQRARQHEENAWNATHPERPDPEAFRREALRGIQGVSLRELARRTGLSVAYSARIRRGEEVPHPRWWEVLSERSRQR